MPDINVQLYSTRWRGMALDVETHAARAARACLALADFKGEAAPAPGGAELTLVLADAALVRQLNRDYRGQDKATNVLSFSTPAQAPGSDSPVPPPYLGDVILCHEVVVEEARVQRKNPVDHLCHLVVHGVLHLLGYDHDTDQKSGEMEALEIRILQSLGIKDPYVLDDGVEDEMRPRSELSGARYG